MRARSTSALPPRSAGRMDRGALPRFAASPHTRAAPPDSVLDRRAAFSEPALSFFPLGLLIRFADLLQLPRVRFRVPGKPLQHLTQCDDSPLGVIARTPVGALRQILQQLVILGAQAPERLQRLLHFTP